MAAPGLTRTGNMATEELGLLMAVASLNPGGYIVYLLWTQYTMVGHVHNHCSCKHRYWKPFSTIYIMFYLKINVLQSKMFYLSHSYWKTYNCASHFASVCKIWKYSDHQAWLILHLHFVNSFWRQLLIVSFDCFTTSCLWRMVWYANKLIKPAPHVSVVEFWLNMFNFYDMC